MPPLTLPPHLSYRSSLVLLPTSSVQEPIQTLRRQHDKHFKRWPPHINLIYPFLATPTEGQSSSVAESPTQSNELQERKIRPDIISRLRKAVSNVRPFTILLNADPAGAFEHGRKSATVWLRPVDLDDEKEGSEIPQIDDGKRDFNLSKAMRGLQAALQAEFAECDADARPFTPHLSIGQAPGAKAAQELVEETKRVIQEFLESKNGMTEPEGASKGGLVWRVDRVFIIERMGFHDPFRIVGDVELGERE